MALFSLHTDDRNCDYVEIITWQANMLGNIEVTLCDKYSPGIDPTDEIAKFMRTVCIVRISIDSMTGKDAIELTRHRKG